MKSLFFQILERLSEHPLLPLQINALDKVGFCPLQKCIIALCMLTYGSVACSLDKYIKMEKKFCFRVPLLCGGVISCFSKVYSRHPIVDDLM